MPEYNKESVTGWGQFCPVNQPASFVMGPLLAVPPGYNRGLAQALRTLAFQPVNLPAPQDVVVPGEAVLLYLVVWVSQ